MQRSSAAGFLFPGQIHLRRSLLACVLSVSITASFLQSAAAEACLRGVNVAGAEFGDLDGAYGRNYTYPSDQTLDWAAARNMSAIRLPFLWERLQPSLFGPFDQAELARLAGTVERANQRGLTVILDVHNYADYRGTKFGTGEVTASAFADFWRRLASLYKNNDAVAFGLMNEPAGLTAKVWFEGAQAAIDAIRGARAGNLVLVPGTIWTGASHWFDDQEGGSNADLFRNISDPDDNFAFEFHQYMDRDFSGTNTTCPRTQDALEALEAVTAWMRLHGFRGYLGEFGGTSSPDCLTGLAEMTHFLNSQDDIWIGWSAWAAGDWWGDYPLSLQPEKGADRSQMKVLLPMLQSDDDSTRTCRSMDRRP
jgi:endoglucanase